ncbi:MAG: hypothetical protein PHD05_07155 [Sphaerochaetaceae bacterium]|nr:hypothetical protein [Sphaerochaetaceae bacterium]
MNETFTFEPFVSWCKNHHLSWFALIIVGISLFFVGRRSSTRSSNDDRHGNFQRNADDLESAATEAGELSGELTTSAGTVEDLANNLEGAGEQVNTVVQGLEQDRRKNDRLEQLLLELRRRNTERNSQLEARKHVAQDNNGGSERGGSRNDNNSNSKIGDA